MKTKTIKLCKNLTNEYGEGFKNNDRTPENFVSVKAHSMICSLERANMQGSYAHHQVCHGTEAYVLVYRVVMSSARRVGHANVPTCGLSHVSLQLEMVDR